MNKKVIFVIVIFAFILGFSFFLGKISFYKVMGPFPFGQNTVIERCACFGNLTWQDHLHLDMDGNIGPKIYECFGYKVCIPTGSPVPE